MTILNRSLITFIFLFSFIIIHSQDEAEITVTELEQIVGFLASDNFGGRLPGTDGDKLSQAYIVGEFQRSGMELLANNGFQYFDVITSVEAGENNVLSYFGKEALMKDRKSVV